MKISIACFVVISLCFHFSVHAKKVITGCVLDANTKEPVDDANVFIANTTYQMYCDRNGKFKIETTLSGPLELIASHISYNSLKISVSGLQDSINLLINLDPINYNLHQVNVISDDPHRVDKFNKFIKGFIGESKSAKSCEILNPLSIHFEQEGVYDMPGGKLDAWADSSIIIYNETLGYKIHFLLCYYCENYNQIAYFGYPYFEDWIEDMPSSKKTSKNREKAYKGSKLHFFRSLYTQTLEKEGFEIYKIELVEKTEKLPVIIGADIELNPNYFGLMSDSVFTGCSDLVMSQTYEPLNLYDYVESDKITGDAILRINEPFEIVYTKRGEEMNYIGNDRIHKGVRRLSRSQGNRL